MASKAIKRGAFREHLTALGGLTEGSSWAAGSKVISVYGTSDLLQTEALQQLRAKALRTGAVVTPLEAASLTENGLLALARQTSLFEPATFYILRRAESAKSLPKILARLKSQEGLANQLCFVYQGDAPAAALAKEFSRLKARGVPCFTPWPNELPQVLTALASRLGLKLSPDGIQALLAAHGEDLVKQANELRKVALILGPAVPDVPGSKQVLTAKILQPHLAMLREDDALLLDQLLLQHDWARAQALATNLLKRGEKALSLLAILANHCRNVLRIAEAQARGLAPAAIAGAVRLSPFVVKNYLPYMANNRDLRRFIGALGRCQEADQLLKSQPIGDELLLARVIDALAKPSYNQ